jgi:hypothetical protein
VFEIWNSQSGTAKDSSLLGCNAVLSGIQFLGTTYPVAQHNITEYLNLLSAPGFK